MHGYELAFIVDASLEEEKREKIVASVKNLIESQKANPGELEVWGKRDFSFPIKKQIQGVYYLLYFQSEPKFLAPIDAKLKIDTNVLRYLIIKQVKRKIKKSKSSGMARRSTGNTVSATAQE